MNRSNLSLCQAAAVCVALGFGAWPAHGADFAGAQILNSSGEVVGAARFEQAPGGVIMDVELAEAPPGWHGIHLHGVGSCSPDFTAAKGHINPATVKHGLRHPEGPDNGDLPNLHVGADGNATAQFYNTRVSIKDGSTGPPLLDDDGAAVIVHANPDDHHTQPIGGAGGRIGCGVVTADAEGQ